MREQISSAPRRPASSPAPPRRPAPRSRSAARAAYPHPDTTLTPRPSPAPAPAPAPHARTLALPAPRSRPSLPPLAPVSDSRPHPSISRLAAFFLGGVPTLKHKEVITQPIDRFRLQTEPSGDVHLTLGVLTKDFARYGVSS